MYGHFVFLGSQSFFLKTLLLLSIGAEVNILNIN